MIHQARWHYTGLLRLICLGILLAAAGLLARAIENVPPDYFAEPANLPFDEEIQQQKQEQGWHWTELRYTSLVYQGEPIRVHAVYAAPDGADAGKKVPAILMTHGIFGAALGSDTRYWSALTAYVKAGYAVFFFDWYPNFARDWKPATPDEPRHFTTFGKLDYFTPAWYWLPGNDMKDTMYYQVAMAARRALTWLQARPEVDDKHIGVTGASYGGIFSSMIAGLDARIAAANPIVYTAGFGQEETGYNRLPKEWSAEQVAFWKARFDSEMLLQQRKVPILYTIGSTDEAFASTKAMTCFERMNDPRWLLIGPNQGHGYWAIEQSVLFFDAILKAKMPRLAVSDLRIAQAGREAVATVQAGGDGATVEIFYAPVFEIDPDLGATGVPALLWHWTTVKAVPTTAGRFEARWPLPVMRPVDPGERLYRWGNGEILNPADPATLAPEPGADKLQGTIYAFARVTDKYGAMTCTPYSAPLLFADPERTANKPVDHALPKFDGGARVKAVTPLDITSTVEAGKPAATFALPLPAAAVGKSGYILWNWRKQSPNATLTTDGTATPTKKILPPFADTVKDDSFQGGKRTADFGDGGQIDCRINGISGLSTSGDWKGTAWHGSVPLGQYGWEEITLQAQDNAEHRLTVVMGSCIYGAANVRVSVRAPDGGSETVQYYQPSTGKQGYYRSLGVDHVLQFRFSGTVKLRVEITSTVAHHPQALFTHVGPTAIFLD